MFIALLSFAARIGDSYAMARDEWLSPRMTLACTEVLGEQRTMLLHGSVRELIFVDTEVDTEVRYSRGVN